MADGILRVHFLNVGHGDCTIIEHPSGRLSVVDINNGSKMDQKSYNEIANALTPAQIYNPLAVSAGLMGYGLPQPSSAKGLASLLLLGQDNDPFYEEYENLTTKGYRNIRTNPIEYLEQLCAREKRDKSIFRYIQTHPDMDHMRGLTDLIEHGFDIYNFWDTNNTKQEPDFQKVFDGDKRDWATYQSLRREEKAKRFVLNRGNTGAYWTYGTSEHEPGDGIEILSPTPQITRSANTDERHNNHSYVLRITYAGISIILGGDAEESVWEDIVNTYGQNLKCHVLKASHHGRDSGYYQPAVKIMKPELTVVSVGTKPETDASNKYKNYCDNVLSTRWCGNITVTVHPDGTARFDKEYNR